MCVCVCNGAKSSGETKRLQAKQMFVGVCLCHAVLLQICEKAKQQLYVSEFCRWSALYGNLVHLMLVKEEQKKMRNRKQKHTPNQQPKCSGNYMNLSTFGARKLIVAA